MRKKGYEGKEQRYSEDGDNRVDFMTIWGVQ